MRHLLNGRQARYYAQSSEAGYQIFHCLSYFQNLPETVYAQFSGMAQCFRLCIKRIVMIADKKKLTPLRIAWHQPVALVEDVQSVNLELKKKKISAKEFNADLTLKKILMPKQPVGYIKAPLYDFF